MPIPEPVIYKLKLALQVISPMIWRRLLVCGDSTIADLHYPDTKQYFVAQSFRQKRFKKPKFGKTRFVDLPDFLVQDLKEYITMLRKGSLAAGRGGRVDLLFIDPTENGGPWPYSQRKVQRLVERVCKKAGLRVRNPHDYRNI